MRPQIRLLWKYVGISLGCGFLIGYVLGLGRTSGEFYLNTYPKIQTPVIFVGLLLIILIAVLYNRSIRLDYLIARFVAICIAFNLGAFVGGAIL